MLDLIEALPADVRQRAFTHRTVDDEQNYEKLELLGDKVLGLIIIEELLSRFPDEDEGRLAKLANYIVSREACAKVCRALDLDQYIRVEEGVHINDNIRADVIEALIGAIWQQLSAQFWDITQPVVDAFDDVINYAVNEYVDHKTVLQEVLQGQGRKPPTYKVLRDGPDHRPTFMAEVTINMDRGSFMVRGVGGNRKAAEQKAAKRALERLR